jgi:hypothetical protein
MPEREITEEWGMGHGAWGIGGLKLFPKKQQNAVQM